MVVKRHLFAHWMLAVVTLWAPLGYADLYVAPSERVVNFVTVRVLPASDSTPIARLRPGDIAEILVSVPSWYLIRLSSGDEGYVSKAWVQVQAAPSSGSSETTAFSLHVIDVGSGDGIVLDMGDAEITIDGGMYARTFSEYVLSRNLIQGPIELAIVTHADTDHWRGLHDYLKGSGTELTEFWEPGYNRTCRRQDSWDAFIEFMQNLVPDDGFKRPLQDFHTPATSTMLPKPFSLPQLPGVEFTLLHSDSNPSGPDCAYQINNASIVLMIRVGGVSILLMGDTNGKRREQQADIEPSEVEAMLLDLEAQWPGILRADILKVAHHGSESASTQAFLDAVQPRFAIISASTPHHLPRASVVSRLETLGAIVLRTDVTRTTGADSIVCIGNGHGEVDCNYANQIMW